MKVILKNLGSALAICAAMSFFQALPAFAASKCDDPGLQSVVRQKCKTAEKHGARAISCFRSQKHQDEIRAQYIAQGRPGQAAKHSRHTQGLACDMNHQIDSMMENEMRLLRLRGHTGNHYSTDGH